MDAFSLVKNICLLLFLQTDSDALKKRMQEVGDSLVSIEQDLAAVKSDTNDSFSRVSTDVDNTGTCSTIHTHFIVNTVERSAKGIF